jgi:hypothetical protein
MKTSHDIAFVLGGLFAIVCFGYWMHSIWALGFMFGLVLMLSAIVEWSSQ